jgi:hypothetical protein
VVSQEKSELGGEEWEVAGSRQSCSSWPQKVISSGIGSDLYDCILIDWICAKCDIFRDSIMSKMPLKDVLYLSSSI